MDLDEKLDRILTDLTALKTTSDQHTVDMKELKDRLEPVFFHVTGIQWLGRLLGGLIAVGTFLVAFVEIFKGKGQ